MCHGTARPARRPSTCALKILSLRSFPLPFRSLLQEDFTIHVTQGGAPDEVAVNMRTRSRSPGGLDGHERITKFMAELQDVRLLR